MLVLKLRVPDFSSPKNSTLKGNCTAVVPSSFDDQECVVTVPPPIGRGW